MDNETKVVTLCGFCGKPVSDFYFEITTHECKKFLCLDCAGANTIQQLSDAGFIDAPEEIMEAPLFAEGYPETPLSQDEAHDVLWEDAKKRHGITDEEPVARAPMTIEAFRERYPATLLSDEEIQNVLNGKNPDGTENKNFDPYWEEKYQ